jgi:WD40 repeat protein
VLTVRLGKRWWLSLAIVVASLVGGLVWWSATQPPGLHLRGVLKVETDSDDGALYVEGFSPDGSMVVARILQSSADAIVVWDIATGKLRKVIGPETSESNNENGETDEKTRPLEFGGNAGIRFLGFSPDGKTIAVANTTKGFQLWDTITWRVCAEIEELNFIECQFLSNGRIALVRSGQEPQIWDLPTRKRLVTLWSASEAAAEIETRLAPDEKTAVIVVSKKDEDGYKWWADTWDMATWRRRQSIQWRDTSRCENGISPDGTLVAGIDDEGVVRFWEVATGRKQSEMRLPSAGGPEQGLIGCGWDPGGHNYLVCLGDGSMLRCDLQNRKTTIVDEEVVPIREDPIFSWSSDGRRLALISHKYVPRNRWIAGLPGVLQRPASSIFGAPRLVHYWSVRSLDVTTGRRQTEHWQEKDLESVAFSPDGSILAVGDYRGKVQLFDVPKAEPSSQ